MKDTDLKTYIVHIRRTWSERFSLEIEAQHFEIAKTVALELAKHESTNWSNMEQEEQVVIAVDDDTGESVFELDADAPTADPVRDEMLAALQAIASWWKETNHPFAYTDEMPAAVFDAMNSAIAIAVQP